MTAIIIAADKTFEQEVLQADRPVLVDFWAPWCGPCRVLTPIIEQIAAERPDIRIVKLNTQDNIATAEAYGIRAVPTLLLVRDGKILAHSLGVSSKENIAKFIDDTLAEQGEGITREEYKQRNDDDYKMQMDSMLLFNRVRSMASSAIKIAGGLTLAFTAAASGYDYFGLVAATFNAVRGVSIYNNKDAIPDLYGSLSGRAFSFISNAATLASGAALTGFAMASGGTLTMLGTGALGLYMLFNGCAGAVRDVRHTLGLTGTRPPAAPPAEEKPACENGACPAPKNGP